MTGALRFFVPGKPVGKGRPRVGKVNGHARMFTPEKTVAYEQLVALAAQQAMAGRALFDGPVDLTLTMLFPVPASWSGKKQRAALAGEILPTVKPDADNQIKAVCDALNGVAWRDDVQVVDGRWRKRYAETPGVEILIAPIAPQAVGLGGVSSSTSVVDLPAASAAGSLSEQGA